MDPMSTFQPKIYDNSRNWGSVLATAGGLVFTVK